ncbi:MAG: hypothetical protein R3C53_21750 [Pirellulaceae bacterium]
MIRSICNLRQWQAAHSLLLQVIAVLIVILVAQLAMAEQPPNRQDDPFYKAIREVHIRQSSDRDLVETLLRFNSIPKEVGLSQEKVGELRSIIGDSIRSTFKLRDELEVGMTHEQIVSRIMEVQAPFEKKIANMLRDKQVMNFDRLLQLYVQHRKTSAVTNSTVADHLGLSTEELQDLRKFRNEMQDKLRDENRDKVADLIRKRKREEIRRLFEAVDEKIDIAMAMQLTAEQRQKLEDMTGERFVFPAPEFGGRPPRRERDPKDRDPVAPKPDCCRRY